jgi:hypothetical protein
MTGKMLEDNIPTKFACAFQYSASFTKKVFESGGE